MKIRRINFQLDKKTYYQFSKIAEDSGITKSKLLNSWIESTQNIYFKPDSITYPTNYNFRVIEKISQKIEELRYYTGLQTSVLLRSIIIEQVEMNADSTAFLSNLKLEWEKGNYKGIISLAENNQEMQFNQLVYVFRSYMELGDFIEVPAILEELKFKAGSQEECLRLKVLEADYLLYTQKHTEALVLLEKVHEEADYLRFTDVKGLAAIHLGEYYGIKDDWNKSIDYLQESIEYLNIFKYPVEFLKIYLRLIIANIYRGCFEEVESLITRVERLLVKVNNRHYEGWFKNNIALYKQMRGEVDLSRKYIEESIHLNLYSNSKLDLSFYMKNLAKIMIYNNKFEDGMRIINKAYEYESFSRPNLNYSRTYQLKLMLMARYDYENSIITMERMLKNSIYPNLGNYYYQVTKYLFAKDKKEKELGIEGLKKIKEEGGYPYVRKAADSTLKSGRLVLLGYR
ncbi:MAG TPA: hypothetical protein VGA67_00045 [Candidatus Dojkabacteria bacterium]|jgi:hypothetical protein